MMQALEEQLTWVPDLLKSPDRGRLDIAHLEKAVKLGSFVPFLGAGASSMRPDGSAGDHGPWQIVDSNLSALFQKLTTKKERSFLRCFAERYRGHLEESTPADLTMEQQDPALFRLQLALVRLLVRLVRIFGLQMWSGSMCVSSPPDLAVRGLGRRLQSEIVECLLASHSLKLEIRELLESKSLWKKLVHFAFEHVDERTWEEIRRKVAQNSEDTTLDDAVGAIRVRGFDFAQRGVRLAISEVAWLTQLLWYTLSYRVCAYPTTAELAFRLSLCSQAVPPRVGELAQAAEAVADYPEVVQQVRKWFQFYDESMRESIGDLHRGVTAALNFAYVNYERASQVHTDQKKARSASYKEEPPSPPYLPMALTTNFDMALEHAFDHLEADYHVVFPVFAKAFSDVQFSVFQNDANTHRNSEFPPIVWLVKNVTFARGGERNKDTWGEVIPDKPGGPVIVKLHGSPLEKLADVKKELNYSDLCHCIVLSESTYLEMILHQTAKFPPWFMSDLQKPKVQLGEASSPSGRSMWFLGYSISDWNVRLRLYQQLYWTLGLPSNQLPGLFAVNREFDRYQSAVLGRLRVVGRAADLRDVAKALLDMPELERYSRRRRS